VGSQWLPPEAAAPLLALLVIAIYLAAMRSLARIIDDRFDPLHDWREAEKRAEAMLSEILPPQELRVLSQKGYLEVRSRKFEDRVYRIPRFQGPVAVYEGGSLTNLLCVRSVDPIPNADAVLMHKLLIEGDEESYLKTANSIRPRPYAISF
jgi:hypothetical protein